MSETAAPPADRRSLAQRTAEAQARLWSRLLPQRLHDIILPGDISEQLSPGEVVLMTIYQAWYRNFSALLFYNYYQVIVIAALLLTSAIAYFQLDLGIFPSALWNLALPWALLLIWLAYAIFENLQYLKWRLVLTNNRLIFATPQRDARYLSDTIQLNGKPRVVDANWSDRDVGRVLQMITGSRDVFISLLGLQFVEGTAKVKDALVMPDVEIAKIERLKRIVFSNGQPAPN